MINIPPLLQITDILKLQFVCLTWKSSLQWKRPFFMSGICIIITQGFQRISFVFSELIGITGKNWTHRLDVHSLPHCPNPTPGVWPKVINSYLIRYSNINLVCFNLLSDLCLNFVFRINVGTLITVGVETFQKTNSLMNNQTLPSKMSKICF